MTASKKCRIALAIFLLAVAALMIWQFRTAQTAQTRLAVAALREATLLSELRTLRSTNVHLDKNRDGKRESLAASMPPAAPQASGDTPAQQKTRIRLLRAWLALRNAALYRELGLSPEQKSQFEDLIVNHFLRLQDIAATAQVEQIPNSDPAIAKLRTEENQQFKQDEIDLLGAPMAQQVQQYDRTAPARMLANAVAGNTYYTEEPLTAQQADQVTQILANNSANYKKGGAVNPTDLDLTATFVQAKDVLSPGQLAAFQNLFQGTQAGTKLGQLLTSLTQGATPAAQAQGSTAGK